MVFLIGQLCYTATESLSPVVIVASKGFNQRDLQYIYHIFLYILHRRKMMSFGDIC